MIPNLGGLGSLISSLFKSMTPWFNSAISVTLPLHTLLWHNLSCGLTYIHRWVPYPMAAAPAMNLKIFLPMGEKPPDTFGRGGDDSPIQASLFITFPHFCQVLQEIFVLQSAILHSTVCLLIVVILCRFADWITVVPGPVLVLVWPQSRSTT
jgi:hypothetical protein